MDYLPTLAERKFTVEEQIAECKRIIYRNNLENLTFKAGNEKKRMLEVDINNQTLKEKIDVLNLELEALNASGSNTTE